MVDLNLPAPLLTVLVVVFRPRLAELAACLQSLASARAEGVDLGVRLWHNDDGAAATTGLAELYEQLRAAGLPLQLEGGQGNLGFGGGINAMLPSLSSPYTLLLNQDAIPEPGALALLAATAQADADDVAAWEMRQIPYEHPKDYDPVSGSTEWCSGAAVLLRTAALQAVGGFEPRIFMYCEDVDLSWRLRCAGWRLRYLPRCAVVHHTYSEPGEVKPLALLGSVYANLCLRTRYAGRREVLQGLGMALRRWLARQAFAGQRMGIAKAIVRFARNYAYFRSTRQAAAGFEPRFAGWDYERRREGAFHAFKAQAEQPVPAPLVSILVRTHHRPGFLRQALASLAQQTHRPLEVVVVEDGSADGEAVCAEFAGRLDLRYFRLDPAQGRSKAGNRALAEARGEWLGFLDDDDLLYADHVEVLLQAAREAGVPGAYGLAWCARTRVLAEVQGLVEESFRSVEPDEPFSRLRLWHHNLMPIQAVLFHRSLYERQGGFVEDMDQLEDWNLWTRFTIDAEFLQLRKLTSLYRVPADFAEAARRQAVLDAAYDEAVRRQERIKFTADPLRVRHLAGDFARQNALIHVDRQQLFSMVGAWPWLARLNVWRTLVWQRWCRNRKRGSA